MTDPAPTCPLEDELEDMRFCRFCTYAATGYGFACEIQGVDPEICPSCKRDGFKPWRELGFEKGSDVFAVKKPGRNEKCPCGDGNKKFKRCCR